MLGKMADAKSLEEILLSQDVDESAVSAIVGTLESQLSSNSRTGSNQRLNAAANIRLSGNNSSNNHSGLASPSVSSEPQARQKTNHPLQSAASQQQPRGPVAEATKAQTTPVSNAALPASGYVQLNQSDVKIVYSTSTSFNPAANNSVIQQARRKITVPIPNGNLNVVRPNAPSPLGLTSVSSPNSVVSTSSAGGGMAAIQNLANVAAQQQPIIIANPNQASPNYPLLNSKQLDNRTKQQQCKNINLSKDNSRRENSGTPPTGGQLMTLHPGLIQAPSTSPAVVTVSKSSTGQPVNVVTQMVSNSGLIPGMQIVNMTPGRGGGPNANAQKTLAPRMVIAGNQVRLSPQVIAAGNRHNAPSPGQNTITLQSGMVRGALLFKTENGQFQVLNMAQGITPTTQSGGAMSGGATYRLQTVQPGHQGGIRTLTPQQIVTSLPVSSASGVKPGQIHTVHTTAGGQHMVGTVLQHGQGGLSHLVTTVGGSIHHGVNTVVSAPNTLLHQQQQHQIIQQHHQTPKVAATSSATQPLSIQTSAANSQSATTPSQMSPNTAKKKCKNFLSTLIRLATDQPEQVATNVKNLIQGLIDGDIQPEDFTNQLQKELNSSPQPCLVPFLKKSLPYLRHSLMTKELTIEGVRPPAPGAVTLPPTPQIIPQIQTRPMLAPNASQVRVMGPGGALTAQLSQPAPTLVAQQRLLTVRSASPRIRSCAPQLNDHSKSVQNFWHKVQNQRHALKEHPNSQFRPRLQAAQSKSLLVTSLAGPRTTTPQSQQTSSTITALGGMAVGGGGGAPVANQTFAMVAPSVTPPTTSASQTKSSKSSASASAKEREKRNFASLSSSRDDDDINDVAAMGGVNLIEESQRILAANAEIVGTQIRSCKDENFFPASPLQQRINSLISQHGLEDASSDVVSLISHAAQERLKTLVEKLGVIAEHRLENIKNDPRFEVTQDVKGQLKFLEELDRLEKKRHEEREREILLRAAKSRSKLEDPEQLKLKQKAKEMQRAELEEMRQREANATALLAIGTRKRQKVEPGTAGSSQPGSSPGSSTANSSTKSQASRPRVKRVNMRDLLFLMEQERETVRTPFLYKSYFK